MWLIFGLRKNLFPKKLEAGIKGKFKFFLLELAAAKQYFSVISGVGPSYFFTT